MTKWNYFVGILSLLPLTVNATHIIGGELNYTCLGSDKYEITLTIYRDCFLGNPNEWFDDPASVGIFDSGSTLLTELGDEGQLFLKLMGNDTLQPQLSDPCLNISADFCVHTTSYRDTLFLPFRKGGYQLVYQRCCRNSTIQNIISPVETGATYVVSISEESLLECNSNAKFNNWPPILICIDQPIEFDHSAFDIDGDSLVYSLCTPLQGADQNNPKPQPPSAPPYNEVVWKPPFELNNVLGGNPLQIDSETGFLTGTPNSIGQFVVGVCVSEFRAGELLSVTKRDFQYNIQSCTSVSSAFFAPQIQCDDLTVDFVNQSSASSSFFWDFGDLSTDADTSILKNPSYTYSDTGTYLVKLISKSSEFCQDSFSTSLKLAVNGIVPSFQIERLECSDTLSIKVNDLSLDTLTNIESWEWSLKFDNNTQVSIEQNPTFFIHDTEEAILSLTVTSENGCNKILHDTFATHLILETMLEDSLLICYGDSIYLNSNPILEYKYVWKPIDFLLSDSNEANPLAKPLISTEFDVKISNIYDCFIEQNVFVEVIDGPGEIKISVSPNPIYLGDKTRLEATFIDDAVYSWSPMESLSNPNIYNPEAYPLETTFYNVSVDTGDECGQASAEVEVLVIELDCKHPYVFVPNVFSPNSDGMNDILFVKSNIVDQMNFSVYNRWGEKVFETHDFTTGWDGYFNGEALPSGVFAYILTGRCLNGKEILQKGNITLLR